MNRDYWFYMGCLLLAVAVVLTFYSSGLAESNYIHDIYIRDFSNSVRR